MKKKAGVWTARFGASWKQTEHHVHQLWYDGSLEREESFCVTSHISGSLALEEKAALEMKQAARNDPQRWGYCEMYEQRQGGFLRQTWPYDIVGSVPIPRYLYEIGGTAKKPGTSDKPFPKHLNGELFPDWIKLGQEKKSKPAPTEQMTLFA